MKNILKTVLVFVTIGLVVSCKKPTACYTCTITTSIRDISYTNGTTSVTTKDYCNKTSEDIINIQNEGTTTTYSYSGTHTMENKTTTTCRQK